MIKTAKRTIVIVGIAAFASSCRGLAQEATHTPALSTLRVVATTTTAPLARDFSQAYIREDALFVLSLSEANWQGVQNELLNDESVYGLTTFLPDGANLWAAPLGEDAIAIITHVDLNIPVLSAEQLRSIFTGTINNWQDVGGPNLPIVLVSREEEADSRLAFQHLVMGERRISGNARLATSSPDTLDIVATTIGSIGYVSLGLIDERVRVTPVVGQVGETPITPSLETIADGSYPLRTPILLVGQREPDADSVAYEFFIWLQQGGGQTIIGRNYVPLTP